MRLVRLLPERARALAPEALRFGAVGLGNTVLYFLIFNVTMGIGAVKATVIATIVTTTLSYLANRHWTYKHRPKTALRREYTLFFAFNLAGMVIQSAVVGIGKYGLGLTESQHRLAFNVATCIGIGLATLFRFWTYRTMVFKSEEPAVGAALAESGPSPRPDRAGAGLSPTGAEPEFAAAGMPAAPQPRTRQVEPLGGELTELSDALDAELAVELAAAELDRAAGQASAQASA